MTTPAERFRSVAAGFTARVDAVPDGAWDDPAPPEGWTARDVVDHLIDWMSGLFFDTWSIPRPELPSVADDPAGAWYGFRDAVQAALDDPELAGQEREIMPGRMTFAVAMDQIGTSDVFMHTWDLARATGGDERLDPDEVHALLVGMEPMDEVLRQSGHFGPRVEVPDDADEQTKLIAFIGRQP
jgi:uncharacterized protein (TIGR03086 family)